MDDLFKQILAANERVRLNAELDRMAEVQMAQQTEIDRLMSAPSGYESQFCQPQRRRPGQQY